MARNVFSTRAGRNDMVKAERQRLSRGLVTWLESLGATTRLDRDGRYDGHEVETSAGTLRVYYDGKGGFLHCRFSDPDRASLAFYGRTAERVDNPDLFRTRAFDGVFVVNRGASGMNGQLNPHSGKFNFHFGRTTGADALDEVKRCLAWCTGERCDGCGSVGPVGSTRDGRCVDCSRNEASARGDC